MSGGAPGALRFDARLAARGFDVRLQVAAGETVAVLGPNGAGKSTLLNIVAGLLRPDEGRADLDGEELFSLGGPAAHRGWLPPHRRGVSLLAQDPLLFPHLSVLDNVAFGPRSDGMDRGESRAVARGWLAEVDAEGLSARRPAELSGGQAQRIAVARALASDPSLLLLDEPLSALDVGVAPAVRRVLRRVLHGRSVILVTHDVLDALMLADRVVVMNDGVVAEEGPTREVLLHPRTQFTADLAALNLFTGVRTATGLVTAEGVAIPAAVAASRAGGSPAGRLMAGDEVAAAIRPSAVSVSTIEPDASVWAVIRGVVTDLEPRGDLVRVRSSGVAADVLPSLVVDLDLAPGIEAWFTFAPTDAALYAL